MRIVFRVGTSGAVVVLLASTLSAATLFTPTGSARAQVINGEGNFESNRGFDQAPDEAASADKPVKPADPATKPDAPRQR